MIQNLYDPPRLMAYLFALQSLLALAASYCWLRAALRPVRLRIAQAAMATAVLFAVVFLRLSAAISLKSGM